MKIKAIGAENIFSFKNITLDLSNKIFCSITGENRDTNDSNGSGKTSLIELPRFINYKKSCKKNILHEGAKSGMAFIVYDHKGKDILIERQFPGDKVKIDDQDALQEEVDRLLGMDDLLFCNTVYYRQEMLNIFASSTPAKQMEMFTAMFPELMKFDVIRKNVGIDKSTSEEKYNIIKAKIDELGESKNIDINAKELEIEKERTELKIVIDKRQLELDMIATLCDNKSKWQNYLFAMSQLKKLKEQHDKEKEKLALIEKDIIEANEEIAKINWKDKEFIYEKTKTDFADRERKLENRTEDLEKYETAMEVKGICPTCLQPINDGLRKKLYQEKIATVKSWIEQYEEDIKKFADKLEELRKIKDDCNIWLSKQTGLEVAKGNLDSVMKSIKSQFDSIKSSMPKKPDISAESIDDSILDLKKKIIDAETIIAEKQNSIATKEAELNAEKQRKERIAELNRQLKEHNELLTISSYWHKQLPIIKIRIVDDNIALMESIMNDYMAELYPTFSIKLDTVSELKTGEVRDKLNFRIITDTLTHREWQDLSGGEKARIALGCQMASIFLQQSVIGFEFYDEIFRAMDDSGIEATVNLLRKRANEGNQIFAISHNKTVYSNFEDNIHIVKENGVSCVKS